MRGAGPSPRQSPRALRPDPGPAMSFFRRKGSRGGGGGEPGRASGAAVGQMGLPGLPPGRRRDPGRRTDAPPSPRRRAPRASLCAGTLQGGGRRPPRAKSEGDRLAGPKACAEPTRVNASSHANSFPGFVCVNCGSGKRKFL